MHKLTKVPTKWRPTVFSLGSNRHSAAETEILQNEAAKLAECWEASPIAKQLVVPNRLHFERATPEEIQQVSCSFSFRTCTSLDDFHPRHFSLLPRTALLALAALFQAIESIGSFPSALS